MTIKFSRLLDSHASHSKPERALLRYCIKKQFWLIKDVPWFFSLIAHAIWWIYKYVYKNGRFFSYFQRLISWPFFVKKKGRNGSKTLQLNQNRYIFSFRCRHFLSLFLSPFILNYTNCLAITGRFSRDILLVIKLIKTIILSACQQLTARNVK